MIDYIQATCPGCRRDLRVRSVYVGRIIQCNHCDHAFVPAPQEPRRDASAGADVNARLGELRALQEERTRLLAEIQAHSLRASEAESLARAAENGRDEATAALRAMAEELEAARRRHAVDVESLAAMEALRDERAHLADELAENRERLKSARAEAQGLANEVASAAAEREQRESLARERDAQLLYLRDEITSLRAAAGESAGAIAHLEDEARSLREALARAEVDALRARAQIGVEVAEQIARGDALRSEVDRLRGEVEARAREGDASRLELARLAHERDGLAEGFSRAVAESHEARLRHREEAESLESRIADSRSSREEAESRCREAIEALGAARAEAERLAAELAGSQSGRDEVAARLDAMGERLLASRREADELTFALTESRRLHAGSESRLEEAAGRLREAEGRIETLSEALALARKERDAEGDRACGLVESLREARAQMEREGLRFETEMRDHHLALEALTQQSESERGKHRRLLQSERARHDEELAARRDDVGRSRVEVEALRAEVLGLRASRDKALRECEAMRREADTLRGQVAQAEAEAREALERAIEMTESRERLAAIAARDRPPSSIEIDITPLSEATGQNGHAHAGFSAATGAPYGTHPAGTPEAAPMVPEVFDLDTARRQIELLTRSLWAVREANAQLRARVAARAPETPPPQVRSGEAHGRAEDEVSWHFGVARRAAWLANRRKSGPG